jgi:hypothetical protein
VDIPDSRLFQCQCMGEGVLLSYWDATWEEVPQVIVTVWHDASMGAGEWGWKTRLQAMWDIIWRGHIGYEYGVILDEGEALGLAEWLRTRPWPVPPREVLPCGCIKHIVEEGSRQHVLSYSTAGAGSVICSEPKCRVNCRHAKAAGP